MTVRMFVIRGLTGDADGQQQHQSGKDVDYGLGGIRQQRDRAGQEEGSALQGQDQGRATEADPGGAALPVRHGRSSSSSSSSACSLPASSNIYSTLRNAYSDAYH